MSQGDTAAVQPMQQRKQQRQILQMMGITQWVRPHAPVVALADIDDVDFAKNSLSINSKTVPSTASTEEDTNSQQANNQIPHELLANDPLDDFSSTDASFNDNDGYYDDSVSDDFASFDDGTVASTIYHFDSLDTDSSHTDYDEQPAEMSTAYQRVPATSTDVSQQKVAAFDLEGGCYKGWVLMVDVRALSAETKALWQNITQALRITCQNNAFPLCPDMDTLELANASVAGYVFRLGRQEHIQVAALTTLPEGVTHPNLKTLPSLKDMLEAPEQKRIFWQRLNEALS